VLLSFYESELAHLAFETDFSQSREIFSTLVKHYICNPKGIKRRRKRATNHVGCSYAWRLILTDNTVPYFDNALLIDEADI
jgi:hypothetical protein